MAYTPENNPYIPGDPYSYDLKWVVTNIKDLIANYTGQIDELKAFIMDYINSLDLSPIVAAQLQEMYDNGDFDAIIASFITDNKVLLVDTDQSGIFTDTEKATGRKNLGASAYNRNLLDNPFFSVNQRNFTTSTEISGIYSADRWLINSGKGTQTLSADGMLLDNTYGNSQTTFQQNLDQDLTGKTVTLSVLDWNGNIYTGTGTIPAQTSVYVEVFRINIPGGRVTFNTRPTGDPSPAHVQIYITPGNSFKVCAVKLEIGSISTLANDVQPNYAEELAKCQRYFVRLSNDPLGFGFISAALTRGFALLPLPVSLRTPSPTISINGSAEVKAAGETISVSSIVNYASWANAANGLGVQVNFSTSAAAVGPFVLSLSANGYIDLSADL